MGFFACSLVIGNIWCQGMDIHIRDHNKSVDLIAMKK